MTSYVIDYQLHSTKVQVIALVSIAYDEHRDYPNKQISLIVLLEEQKKKTCRRTWFHIRVSIFR